jgi:hypothetical protein
MSKTIRMIRTIVPTPMYMAFPSWQSRQERKSAPCQQALALPTVGLSKPAGAPSPQ